MKPRISSTSVFFKHVYFDLDEEARMADTEQKIKFYIYEYIHIYISIYYIFRKRQRGRGNEMRYDRYLYV